MPHGPAAAQERAAPPARARVSALAASALDRLWFALGAALLFWGGLYWAIH